MTWFIKYKTWIFFSYSWLNLSCSWLQMLMQKGWIQNVSSAATKCLHAKTTSFLQIIMNDYIIVWEYDAFHDSCMCKHYNLQATKHKWRRKGWFGLIFHWIAKSHVGTFPSQSEPRINRLFKNSLVFINETHVVRHIVKCQDSSPVVQIHSYFGAIWLKLRKCCLIVMPKFYMNTFTA